MSVDEAGFKKLKPIPAIALLLSITGLAYMANHALLLCHVCGCVVALALTPDSCPRDLLQRKTLEKRHNCCIDSSVGVNIPCVITLSCNIVKSGLTALIERLNCTQNESLQNIEGINIRWEAPGFNFFFFYL